MGERVHAGGGGKLRGQIGGEIGVENDELREEARQENDRPALRAGGSDHGTAAHFAAGTGRGGDAHATGQVAPVVVEIEFGELEVRTLYEQATGFAHVERAAAAEGDDGIALRFAKDFC